MNLSQCIQGTVATVVHVNGTGALRRRLLEMGVVSGARMTVVKYAPLRDPIEIVLGDAHISLRVAEAATIDVTIDDVTSPPADGGR